MSKISVSNNYNIGLLGGSSFVGVDENTAFALGISVYVASPTLGLITIKQSNSIGGPYQLTDTFNYGSSVLDSMQVYRVPRGFSYFHVEFLNAEGTQTYLSLNTYLDSTFVSDEVSVSNVVDISGSVIVTNVVDISGSVVVTSQPHLSYLTDNIAVATMPAITGTVAVSSQPHLSYLTDNVAVATMPAITGTVAVSSQPHLSYLTDNVAVATQPALAFSTDKVDVTGSSISVSSLPAITGSVSASITTNPVIVKEKPSYTVNLDALDTTSQTIRSSAGCLSGLCLSHVGGSQFCYVKIYNASSATSADTPLATFSIYKDTTQIIDTHAMNFSGGLCVRGTDNYGASDNTSPSGSLKLVAFVTGYSE